MIEIMFTYTNGIARYVRSPVLSPTRRLKVVVCFGENRFVPLSSNCSVIKASHYVYLCNISVLGYQETPQRDLNSVNTRVITTRSPTHPSTNPVQQGLSLVDQREAVSLLQFVTST